MPSIHDLVASGDWAEVQNKLRSREKDELFNSSNTCEDTGGATPFHLACANEHVPQDIIKAMMVIDGNNLNTMLKRYDATPLHLACETGSTKTVRTLLVWASDEGCVEDYVGTKDSGKRDALDITWSRHLQPDPSYLGNDPNMSESLSKFFHKLAGINSPEDLSGEIKDTWEKTILLIKARTTGTVDASSFKGGQWNVVRSIAEDRLCPSIAMWLALKLFPEQAQWKDGNGDLPLHISSSEGDIYNIDVVDPGDLDDRAKSIYEQSREDVSAMILKCYPDAAKVPNKEGRLPLHLECDNQLMPGTTVASFLEANPESVNSRDPVSKLFPFMLAACDLEDEDENLSDGGTILDATYILLRENPANVEGGICLTEYEKYLKTKLDEEKTRSKQHLARVAELESRLRKRKHSDDC